MSHITVTRRAFFLGVVASLVFLVGSPSSAQVEKKTTDRLEPPARHAPQLAPSPQSVPIAEATGLLSASVRADWDAFVVAAGGKWNGVIDKRTGRVAFVQGSGVPWIPGSGNRLSAADLAKRGAGKEPADVATLERIARAFLPRVARMLGVDVPSLTLNKARSAHPADYLWFVEFDVARGKQPVEGARVLFRVNNGNLIQFGSENLPSPDAAVPEQRIGKEQARAILDHYVLDPGAADHFLDGGSLHLLPADVEQPHEFGRGRGLVLVWQFTFVRAQVEGTWRGRVDATTGEVLELTDVNDYAEVGGGVQIISGKANKELVLPMPSTNVTPYTSEGPFTNTAGRYDGSAQLTTLSGRYVRVADRCGALSQSVSASGDICLNTSGGTDCTTPGNGGAGNTHAARTSFYHVNRAQEIARGWLCPGGSACSWLDATYGLVVRTNLHPGDSVDSIPCGPELCPGNPCQPICCDPYNPECIVCPVEQCNGYWDGCNLNLARSCSGFANFGENPDVVIHEFGHGLDQNDGVLSTDKGTGETYGDFTAALTNRNACMGDGMLSGTCGPSGDPCLYCTGIRDIDWGGHTSQTPHTVDNWTRTVCSGSTYAGPCGREGHCESQVSSEALWDLAARDLPSPGTNTAWTVMERLWYKSRGTAGQAFTCNSSNPNQFTSDGCSAGSSFNVLLAADDDDGNLGNGTPHGCNIFAAFDRHGIACQAYAAIPCSSQCQPPSAPTVTVTAFDSKVNVSWTSAGPGMVYEVFHNDAGCGYEFAKIASDVTGLTFDDTEVANGYTYSYVVVAHPSGNEACSSAPSTCASATPHGFVLAATAVSTNRIDLSWTAAASASEYQIQRSASLNGTYYQIDTVAPPATTYTNTGLTGGTTYYYLVKAVSSCLADNATNKASAVAAGSACTSPGTRYTNNFETGSGLSDWTTSGTGSVDWRGIQTCTAQSGSKIFRFGGTTCTADYGIGKHFTDAQPSGATGLTIPLGNTTRLTFAQRRRFEDHDGGALRVSVDGGPFAYVPSYAISGAGYNGVVTDRNNCVPPYDPENPCLACNPAGTTGVSIFTGIQSTFVTSTVDLDLACIAATGHGGGCGGHNVRIVFTAIADCTGTEDGWFLDDVNVTSCSP